MYPKKELNEQEYCYTMETINGEFIMRGLAWNDPHRIKSPEELTAWVDQIGFVPLFANDVDAKVPLFHERAKRLTRLRFQTLYVLSRRGKRLL